MSEKCDKMKLVRLEGDVSAELVKIQKQCEWPVKMIALASFAARNGLPATRKTFNPKNATKKG